MKEGIAVVEKKNTTKAKRIRLGVYAERDRQNIVNHDYSKQSIRVFGM